MRKLICSMTVSLDGFVAGPAGELDWGAPDEELHQFHNDEVRELGVHLLGRRLYETMVYWETPEQGEGVGEVHREFATIWQALPKIVYSSTLEEVEGNTELRRGGLLEDVAQLKREPGNDIAAGGPGLNSQLIAAGLVDDYRLFVRPIVLGAGIPYFPALDHRIALELVDRRSFAGGVTYLRYRPV